MSTNHLASLLNEQMNEILISEILFLDVLPIIQKKVTSTYLLRGIRDFKRLIRNQSRSVQKILNKLKAEFKKVRPEEFEMLLAEVINVTEYSCEPEVADMTIASGLSKLNGFQISCYGAASIYARTLGHQKIAHQLQQIINEKKSCLRKISITAKDSLDDK